ncbi:MAG: hypothetical protein LBH05_00395 [Deferribacteraceae bacterium]|jgi:predicted esterase YcpF (UPF0227 family)|nr:hypothetical protein [Deferribacteraceae bacterium]
MLNILYIHEYEATGNSPTALQLKELLEDYARLVAPDFSKNPNIAIQKTVSVISMYRIGLIIGNSYGGFVALNTPKLIPRIVINPVLEPSNELVKRHTDATKFVQDFKDLETKLFTRHIPDEEKAITYGIFSSYDEKFSYKDMFLQYYNNAEIMNNDGHKIKPSNVKKTLVPLIIQWIRLLQLY